MTTETVTLDDCEHEYADDGGQTWTYDHPAGLIMVQLVPDPDCTSPLDPDWEDGLPAFAMVGHDDYIGTADSLPYELGVGCPHCEAADAYCDSCEYGEIRADVDTYLRIERDAIATLEITIGGRNQAPAVLYFTAGDADDITDPAAALRAYAEEYRRWEDGDCWGYICHGPNPADEDSCWGFIGAEYAREEAAAAFAGAVADADRELAESTYWAARGVLTV
jgi:hypothetical protein